MTHSTTKAPLNNSNVCRKCTFYRPLLLITFHVDVVGVTGEFADDSLLQLSQKFLRLLVDTFPFLPINCFHIIGDRNGNPIHRFIGLSRRRNSTGFSAAQRTTELRIAWKSSSLIRVSLSGFFFWQEGTNKYDHGHYQTEVPGLPIYLDLRSPTALKVLLRIVKFFVRIDNKLGWPETKLDVRAYKLLAVSDKPQKLHLYVEKAADALVSTT